MPLLHAAVCSLLLCCGSGCGSLFNTSFLNLVASPSPDRTGTVSAITIDNVPGHVPIVFINNTRFDQNLLDYLDRIGVDVSDPTLRPRVRLRVNVRFVNGGTNTIEFLDGSDIIQSSVVTAEGTQANPGVPRALTDGELRNAVVICDVAEVDPQASVEIFVPSFLKVITLQEGNFVVVRELQNVIPPQFTQLQADDVDANGDLVLQRNFDIRDVPAQVNNVQCGSSIGFTLNGTLQVPFVVDELGQTVPGWRDTDDTAAAGSPGRFDFVTSVR